MTTWFTEWLDGWRESTTQAFSSWGPNAPWGTFIVSLVLFAFLLLTLAVVGHLILTKIAWSVRSCAEWLAGGATLDDIVRLESSSARIERALRWLATRAVTTQYESSAQPPRLPKQGRGNLTRKLLRNLWLALRWLWIALASIPKIVFSWLGLVVVVSAVLTAFPSTILTGAERARSVLLEAEWSIPTAVAMATIIAAMTPISIMAIRALASETGTARRTFRQGRETSALQQLHAAAPAIAALAGVVQSQLDEMVRTYAIQEYRAQEWYAWTQQHRPEHRHHFPQSDDHVECNQSCLDLPLTRARPYLHNEETQAAIAGIELAWKDQLKDEVLTLSRIVNLPAWSGLMTLRSCFSTKTEKFIQHVVPSVDEWYVRRIAWQHRQLVPGSPARADNEAGRNVRVNSRLDPSAKWLEDELHALVWKLAGLSRELTSLANFAYALTRPRRFERLARLSDS